MIKYSMSLVTSACVGQGVHCASTQCTDEITSDQWQLGFIPKNLLFDVVCSKLPRCQTKQC